MQFNCPGCQGAVEEWPGMSSTKLFCYVRDRFSVIYGCMTITGKSEYHETSPSVKDIHVTVKMVL